MKNKGFTLVELITTFALTSVIIVLLINVIVAIKNVYSNTSVKTELYINQSNLSHALNSKINGNLLTSYEECTDVASCYEFQFSDGTSTKLTITDKQIKFGDYVYNLDKKTNVETVTVGPDDSNKFLVLKIPITNELYPDIDFGINLVYAY